MKIIAQQYWHFHLLQLHPRWQAVVMVLSTSIHQKKWQISTSIKWI